VNCGTDEGDDMFDSCGGLGHDEEFEFTFDYSGNWGYHDHLNPTWTGEIIVHALTPKI